MMGAMHKTAESHLRTVAVVVLALIAGPACQTPTARASIDGNTAPDLRLGAAEYPDADAINLRWEQHWTLDPDGTIHRRDHRWLKLLNSRPIRGNADPRIDFVDGEDHVIIHAAQTHLPDGSIVPVPDYSFNLAVPNDVAGWSEYADWQQRIVSFSAIEPGVVLELDYEVVTPPGVAPWFDADLKLDHQYPTAQRVVTVTVPKGMTLHHRASNLPAGTGTPTETAQGGQVTYRWGFSDLPVDLAEPHAPPWPDRTGRLRLSTCPSSAAWTRVMLEPVERAAVVSEAVKAFAEAAVEDESDPAERVRKLQGKLHDSFNIVTSPKTMRTLSCRLADVVLRSNYGNPLEAAALLMASMRSLGMTATPSVGINARLWDPSDSMPPTLDAFAGVAVLAELPEETVLVHPQVGIVQDPGNWGRHWLVNLDGQGNPANAYVSGRGEKTTSRLDIGGKIAIDAEGLATGELRIRATGFFFDPQKLTTADAQGAFVKKIVSRVIRDVEVTSHSIETLSPGLFRVTAMIASSEPLEERGGLRLLRLGKGPAFVPDVPMSLGRSQRHLPVRLPGRFREQFDLIIELPEGWAAAVAPSALPRAAGDWGSVAQEVKVDGGTVHVRRDISVTTDTLAPDAFAPLRRAVNELRATKCRLLLMRPGSGEGDA